MMSFSVFKNAAQSRKARAWADVESDAGSDFGEGNASEDASTDVKS